MTLEHIDEKHLQGTQNSSPNISNCWEKNRGKNKSVILPCFSESTVSPHPDYMRGVGWIPHLTEALIALRKIHWKMNNQRRGTASVLEMTHLSVLLAKATADRGYNRRL